MSRDPLQTQSSYWDEEINEFDAIYSHRKSGFANWLDRVFRADMYGRFDYTMRNSGPVEGTSILDVGCGTGRYSFAYLERKCRRVVGIDVSPAMIERCREQLRHRGFSGVAHFERTDLLAFRTAERFDISIAIGLFDYIREPLPVLEKMAALTGERAIVSFPRRWTWRAPVRKIRLARKGCPVYFFTRNQAEALLRTAGFRAVELAVVGNLFCAVARK